MKNHDEKKTLIIDEYFAMSLINGNDMVDKPIEIRGSIDKKQYVKHECVDNVWYQRDEEEIDSKDSERLWLKKDNMFTRMIGTWKWNLYFDEKFFIRIDKGDMVVTESYESYDELVNVVKMKGSVKARKLFIPTEKELRGLNMN